MLKKIMKHEWKATCRIFIPIYVILGVLTILNCFTISYSDTLFENILGLALSILIPVYLFIFMSPYLFVTIRFYKTTATREAYLTFTIPADTKIILLGKYLISMLWVIVTSILCGISLFVTLYCSGSKTLLREIVSFEPKYLLWICSMLLSLSLTILTVFAAISFSQLVCNHRLIASIGFYAALYTIQQILMTLVLVPFLISSFRNSSTAAAPGFQFDVSMPQTLPNFSLSLLYLEA